MLIKFVGGKMRKLFIILSLLLSLSMSQDYSLQFDGENDYIVSESSLNTDFSANGLSFEVTFKSDPQNNESDEIKYLISQYSHVNFSDNNATAELGIYYGQLHVHLRDNGYNTAISSMIGQGLSDGDWHNVKLSYDGQNNYLEIIIDNIVEFSNYINDVERIFPPSSSMLYVGAQQYYGHYFMGQIRDLKIWNEPIDLNDFGLGE